MKGGRRDSKTLQHLAIGTVPTEACSKDFVDTFEEWITHPSTRPKA
jgi:hypothetical protein